MKRKTLGIAVAVAIGVLSTSAFAITPFGNNSNKGSALIYSRIEVGSSTDTLITLTNDSAGPVRLKCYYATSDEIPTPYTGTLAGARSYKHKLDFTIDLTHNQPVSWWASSGYAAQESAKVDQVAPPFGIYPDGASRYAGELKCWAVTADGSTEQHYNHLFGTASIFNFWSYQAWEYTATAFQALGAATLTGTALGSPGVLNLDNSEYDACPNILLGNFVPNGYWAYGEQSHTQVTLASCNQDLRQAYTPTITKLTWTFWNQDESARTGTHWCADSWYETNFPLQDNRWFQSTYYSLGTAAAYFRIETTADTQVCGIGTTTSAYVGVMEEDFGGYYARGTNLVGRGVANGAIRYDVSPPDSFKK